MTLADTPRTNTYEELRQQALAELAAQTLDRDRDQGTIRTLLRRVVEGYQRTARAGVGGPALADPADMLARLERSVLGYGPLQPFIDVRADAQYIAAPGAERVGTGTRVPDVVEVEIRGSSLAWRDTNGRWHTTTEPTTEEELRAVLDRLLQDAGAELTDASPVVSTQVLDRQVRLTASIPPVSDGLEANLRFYGRSWRSLDDLVALDTVSGAAAGFLRVVMRHPQTGLVVSGRPQAGKTTLANALLRVVPPSHVVACCEDTRELSAPLPHASFRQTTEAGLGGDGNLVDLRRLVALALRTSPDRIVVGEVRGAEAVELTRANNAGSAMLTTVHAASARDALDALAHAALLGSGHQMPAEVVRAVFARTVDVVVHLDSEDVELRGSSDDRPARRQVMEIAAVSPLQGSDTRFSVVPIFERDGLGGPLRWTETPLPADLEQKLDQVLARYGVTVAEVLAGREVTLR